ncbi:hypothetical protein D3C81_1116740 [compost metagenome]
MQVVGDAAGADQQHALFAQRRQRAAHRELMRRAQRRLDRQLQHRDVRLRVEVAQRHPGAVVQATVRVDGRLQAGGLQALGDVLRQLGRARGRVLQLVQRVGEAAEIVDRLRRGRTRYHRRACQPMRRGHDDGARALQARCQLRQARSHLARLQRGHRRTMGDVERGQMAHGGCLWGIGEHAGKLIARRHGNK